jgi:hypothetical protein
LLHVECVRLHVLKLDADCVLHALDAACVLHALTLDIDGVPSMRRTLRAATVTLHADCVLHALTLDAGGVPDVLDVAYYTHYAQTAHYTHWARSECV